MKHYLTPSKVSTLGVDLRIKPLNTLEVLIPQISRLNFVATVTALKINDEYEKWFRDKELAFRLVA